MSRLSTVDRFLSKVRRTETCWLWQGFRDKDGYGSFGIGRKMPSLRAHRVSYWLFIGPIPPGAHILHSCDNPPCVNPKHLRAGTHLENVRDMVEKGRGPSGERNGWAKLSEPAVAEIKRSKGKVSRQELANRFGVCMATISLIWMGRIWRENYA